LYGLHLYKYAKKLRAFPYPDIIYHRQFFKNTKELCGGSAVPLLLKVFVGLCLFEFKKGRAYSFFIYSFLM
jgi:hypothetical protein